MANTPSNPIVNIWTTLWQPDQPGSDKPDFVYKKGDYYRKFVITYEDGSSEIYTAQEPEITNG